MLNVNRLKGTLPSLLERNIVPLPQSLEKFSFKQGHLFVVGISPPTLLLPVLSDIAVYSGESEKITFRLPDSPVKATTGAPILSGEVNFLDEIQTAQFFSVFARTVNVPGDNVNEVEVPNAYTSFYLGGKYTEDTISITFPDLISSPLYRFFRSWIRLVCDPITGAMNVPSIYTGTIVVSEYCVEGRNKRVPTTVQIFVDAFPTSVAGYTLDITSDDVVTFDVTFRGYKFLEEELSIPIEDIRSVIESSGEES